MGNAYHIIFEQLLTQQRLLWHNLKKHISHNKHLFSLCTISCSFFGHQKPDVGLEDGMDKCIPTLDFCVLDEDGIIPALSLCGYGYVIQTWLKLYILFHTYCTWSKTWTLTQCGSMRVSAQIFVQIYDSERISFIWGLLERCRAGLFVSQNAIKQVPVT